MTRGAFLHLWESLKGLPKPVEASWSFWFRPTYSFFRLAHSTFGMVLSTFGFFLSFFGWVRSAFVWGRSTCGWDRSTFFGSGRSPTFGGGRSTFGWDCYTFGWDRSTFGWGRSAFGWGTRQGRGEASPWRVVIVVAGVVDIVDVADVAVIDVVVAVRCWSVPRRCSSSSPSTGSPSGRRRRRRLPTTTTYIGDRTSSHNSVSRRPSSYSAWTHHPEDNDRARGSDGSPGSPRPFTRRPSASSARDKCIHPPARACLASESGCNELRLNVMP